MVDHLHSKNLLPFRKKRNGFRLPGAATEEEEQMVEEVDPKLRPDEQGFVRHYLGFADVLLNSPAPPERSNLGLTLRDNASEQEPRDDRDEIEQREAA
ncbi:MAG TPA: hypothetical protein VFI72_03145 [Candidatus Angelobacter sp.]|nr:hypothetical protein [Candidatus Angelobacter sp.]